MFSTEIENSELSKVDDTGSPGLTMVTTWNMKCGIATYTRFLTSHLKKDIRIRISPITSPPPNNPLYFASLAIKACKNSDIVHVQLEPNIFGQFKLFGFSIFPLCYVFFLFLFLFGANKKIVVTLHTNPGSIGGRTSTYVGKFISRLIYSRSDAVIVHTQNSREILLRLARNAKVEIIPHGSYENPAILDKETSKKSLGLSGKKVVTIFGFVYRYKRHDILVDLMPKFADDVRLVIAGGVQDVTASDYLEFLKNRARELGIENKVIFLDYVPEDKIPLVLSATDVAALPYSYSTESGVLHIILAHLVPTITSDLPNFVEIKTKFDCIIIFKRNDEEELFEKISLLLNDENEQAHLITNCKKFWESTHWGVISRMHEALYSRLAMARDSNWELAEDFNA